MEREQQREAPQAEGAPPVEAEQHAAPGAQPVKSGAVPAVKQEPAVGTGRTASEQAYDPAQAAKAKQAEADTKKVLAYIQTQAKAKGKAKQSLDKNSMLQQRLQQYYLKDYLSKPSPEAGKQAVDGVGKQMDPAKADQTDFWEAGASQWNSHQVPPGLKLLIPDAPAEMGAATDALSKENRKHMNYIDAPQLVGKPNTETGENADVYGGGKNVSQLMHWATGVKHSGNDPQTMRDLFLAYEYFHLEGFDKFGEDAINDLIAEEGGRIMGRQLTAGQINNENLNTKLNEGFDESRAWVGSMVKTRQGDLDNVITSHEVVQSQMWWGAMPEEVKWWGDSTIYLDLLNGQTVEQVCADQRTEHFIDIYSLIYFSDEWQKEHGHIDHSNFTEGMLKGKYDKVFEKSVKGEALSKREKVDAYLDAKAPWVPGFIRPLIEKLAAKKLGDDEPPKK